MILSPWLGIVMVLAILGLVITGVKLFGARLKLHPETSRKTVHVAMGLVTLSFPWIFRVTWPVFLLALIAVAGLAGLRFLAPLRDRFGGVLHGVDRRSLGEIYFPLAVAILFQLYRGNFVMYVIPLLTLTLADAVAALVGVHYGQHRYTTSEGAKSTEGSVAFFTIAFLSVHVPLLLMSDTGRAESLLIALVIGILVMLFEALSVGGIDNLFIPLGCYSLLKHYLSLDSGDLLWRFGAISLVAVLVFLWRKRTTLRESGLLAAALVGYMNLTLGGWEWLLVSLVLFLTYELIWPKSPGSSRPVHTMQAVAFVAAPGMLWLMAGVESRSFNWFIPFLLTYAVQSVFVGMIELENAKPKQPLGKRLMQSVFTTWLFFAPLFLLPVEGAERLSRIELWALVAALPLLTVSGILYHTLAKRYGAQDEGFGRWLRRAMIALTVSGMAWMAFDRTGPLHFLYQ